MNGKLKVGILGATGSVGQRLLGLLHEHPFFEISTLAASERSAGKTYAEAVHWTAPFSPPSSVMRMKVIPVDEAEGCDFYFSALDARTADRVERRLARRGAIIVSNASALRMDPDVPLVVPEVNPAHLDLVRNRNGGWVVTNPNCATIGLVLALKPLVDAFGVEAVMVTTMQAISGAGYPGVPAIDILGNVIPHIEGEIDKIEHEPRKIFGRIGDGRIDEIPLLISALATRAPVVDGHLLSISVKLKKGVEIDEIRAAMEAFRGPLSALNLPSAPGRPLRILSGRSDPQPRLHAEYGKGMTVSIGQIRRCPILDLRFVALVHNTLRGAAGAAVLNAELLVAKGFLPRPGYNQAVENHDG